MELLNCPFCGGEAELWRSNETHKRKAWIACMGRCAVLITSEHKTDEEARDAWNTRATSEADALRAAAKAVIDRWDSTDWKAAPTADVMNELRTALKGGDA